MWLTQHFLEELSRRRLISVGGFSILIPFAIALKRAGPVAVKKLGRSILM